MKLLLDENLSRRVVPLLQDAFAGSSQVALLGLERASDIEIWQFARGNDFVIVTNDADFEELSLIRGAPPHVVRLVGENLSRAETLSLLSAHRQFIQDRIAEGIPCIEIIKRDSHSGRG